MLTAAEVEVYVLGYGGWISNPHLGYTSLYVKSDVSILIDVGECAYARLVQCGLQWPDALFISHRHGDHILGVPTFLLLARRQGRRLKIVASREVIDAVKTLASVTGVENSLPYVEFINAEGVVKIGDTTLRFAPTAHPVETLAVRVEHGGRCLVYSSDTAPSDAVVKLAEGCDLLIHEVSGNPGQEEEAHRVGHSTTADAVAAAAKAGVKMLMPIHFYVEQPVLPPGVKIVVPTPCGRVVL